MFRRVPFCYRHNIPSLQLFLQMARLPSHAARHESQSRVENCHHAEEHGANTKAENAASKPFVEAEAPCIARTGTAIARLMNSVGFFLQRVGKQTRWKRVLTSQPSSSSITPWGDAATGASFCELT